MNITKKKMAGILVAVALLCSILPVQYAYADRIQVVDNSPYAGKTISVLGDSISTYVGFIPTEDAENLEHRAKYPNKQILTNVNKTWWMQLVLQLDADLGINDSWAGSTVSNSLDGNSGDWGENAAMASLTRIKNLGANGTPDVILFYGGTNDIGLGVPRGYFYPESAPTEVDLESTKWISFVDAYCATILRMQYFYPEAQIVAILPTYTIDYYTDGKLQYFNEEIIEICDFYDIPWVDLRHSGITTDMMPDGIHPDAEGMDYITDAVQDKLLALADINTDKNE